MITITDIRCALTQKALDTFCELFHIPDEVHHVLPTPNDTMHERPARKIGLYTRFFDFANFRLPLSTFLVDILRHFRINISQLSVIEPFLRFVRLSRHYTLDEENYPWFVDRNREDMDLFAFIHIPDPTKVRVVERNGLRNLSEEDVAVGEPRRLQKKRQAATKAGGSSHPPKKLKSDYGAPNVVAYAGKSPSDLGDLLAKSMLIVESDVEVAATLPFVTSSVSAKPECYIGVLTALERFLISSDSSHHSFNAYEAEEPGTKVVTPVHASMFQDSNSIGTMRPDVAGPSHAPEKELSVGSREVNSENLHEVYVPPWSIPNDSLLDSLDASQEFIDHLAPSACLSAKVRMQTEFCLSERGRFESELEKQTDLLKTKDKKVEDLKAQLFLKEAEAAEAIRLHAEASNFEAMERSLRDELSILNEQREITTPNAQLTAIKSQNNNFVDQVHEPRKAIEKGMQDGLAVGITHCAEGRTLADVAGYNPSTEAKMLMNILRLKDTLAERLGLIGSQPHVDQLMFPIHHTPDKVVFGSTSLSFALDVSNARVRKIKENIMSEGSAPREVFI
uniref:Transposase (Putative), gypsy type n=1 Tax=Tanacetum cinerariifolium TaxID=118510 RepID=A0A6L2MPE9_TANCI|nr:transposase (putative), gypsy type [Tanacetum cinerariifolium]